MVGWAEFGPVRVALAPGVFVPRRRAEAILEPAVALEPDARVVVDLGCGAGALAASLAVLLPYAEVHGVDIDEAALECARRTGGFQVHHGSWWSGLPAELEGRVDLAVAYLPHVPTASSPTSTPTSAPTSRTSPSTAAPTASTPCAPSWPTSTRGSPPTVSFVTLVSRAQSVVAGLEVLHADGSDAVAVHRLF